MLESRSYYHTNEHVQHLGYIAERVSYKRFKEMKAKFGYKSVFDSYDTSDKTIEVLIPEADYQKKHNIGNRYNLRVFVFLVTFKDETTEEIEMKAKNVENAKQNLKKQFYDVDKIELL